jgi:hypothetical protein
LSTHGNILADVTYLEHRALNGNPFIKFLVINHYNPEGTNAPRDVHPLGVFYSDIRQRWSVYNDNQANMELGRAWNVVIPPQDDTLILHTSSPANTSGSRTVIDYQPFNSQPGAILFTQHVYNPGGGSGSFYTRTVVVAYDNVLSRWTIMNADGSLMPLGIHFFVLKASSDEIAFHHVSTGANHVISNGTAIDNPWANANPDALLVVTQDFGTGVTNQANNHAPGVWYSQADKRWVIFNEDSFTMTNGLMFNVLVIPPKSGFLLHTANAGNIIGTYTLLDDPALNGNPYLRIYVTHNFSPPWTTLNVLNDHPLGVSFSSGHWYIFNRESAPMPIGAAFNVYYTWPRGNSFIVTTSNTNTTTARSLTLNHPLLNVQPGAVAQTTLNNNPLGLNANGYSDPVGFKYDGAANLWQIFNNTGANFPDVMSFNVLIPPAGTFVHTAVGGNIIGAETIIDNPLTNNDPQALVFVVARDNSGLNEHNLGVAYSGAHWRVYNEDTSAMALSSAFNIFVINRRFEFLPTIFRQ